MKSFTQKVVHAWLVRSNPHVVTHNAYPSSYESLVPNPKYHPGKASRIYKRHSWLIDLFIDGQPKSA